MLQNERFGTDLKRYLPYTRILDQSKTSEQYFRLFDVPDKLYVGKNSFRIRINKDTLVKGSMIYIDIVDSTGEIIFHEVADFIGEDGSRLIIVHVYEDTPPGEATIYIGGRASYDVINRTQLPYNNDPTTTDFVDFPNIIWSGKVVVIPTNENENEIIFSKPPTVKVKERFEQYRSYETGQSRQTYVSGAFNVTITPVTTPYEYSDSSKSATKLFENSLNVILDPGVSNNTAESRQKSLPKYSELSTLHDSNGNFTEDYVGGEIIIRGLTEQLESNDATVTDFSASIIEVIDDFNIKIAPEFKFVYGEKNENVLKAIKNATNVTASYYTTKQQLTTFDSESFIQLDFENLEPIAGKVDSVGLSYKPYGSFGEFTPIGEFRLKPQEYLIDSSSLVINKTELIERPIGRPSGSSEFSQYWEVIPGKYGAGAYTSGSFSNQGIYFKTDNAINDPNIIYDYKLKVKPGYGIRTVPNTEFKISFTINLEEKRTNDEDFQLDVFISGSSFLREIIADKKTTNLITDGSEGERVNCVTRQTTGAVTTYTFYFKTISGGDIYPVFVIKNAFVFSMKNISIQPRNEFGYSPNQARLFVPLETLKTNTELVLNIDYLTKKKERSKISSQVYGLFFSGSGLTPAIVDNGLSGSIVFNDVSQSIANTSVQTSGSTLYSFNPLTQNFSTTGSIFLGSAAGTAAYGSDYSVFLGYLAGYDANTAPASVFIGPEAGYNAWSADSSSFIGYKSGYNSFNANKSIFIGPESGYECDQANNSVFLGTRAGYFAERAAVSVMIGSNTGTNSTRAVYSTFIGADTGRDAPAAEHSNFIGASAGSNAISASYSNFIGEDAGRLAVSASNSILIGVNSGRPTSAANSIGSDNIVIGNGISVPVKSTKQVNIAGLIFGSSSFSDISSTAFSGSANGRVGINQPNPQYSFDVSGSGNYTNGLTITGSVIATSFTGSLFGTASHATIKTSGSTIYTHDPLTTGFNTTGAVIIGPSSAGQNSTNSQFAVMIGAAAGLGATTSQYAVMMGTSAGNGASNSEYAVMLGRWAGVSATNASSSVMVGREAGRNATNTALSTFVGPYAGFTATNARNSTFIGNQAGYTATNANDSVFIGTNAGYAATNAVQSLFYGPNAGFQAGAATLSTFIGNESGYQAISASYSVFIGNLSGQTATSASFSTFIGRSAGQAATKASSATFIGGTSGYAATFANNGTFIGAGSGESAASASYSILIGNYAGATSLASNTIGSYNTVIGTGISVPVNSARALNICGLIFGTGSYASANLDAFSGSANGRIGINQPNPLYPFDVSGSANFSNDVLITGSLKVSGSNTFTNIGPAIFSGSATVYSDSLQILSGSCNLLSSSLSIQTGSVSFNYRQVTSRYKIGDYDYTINCSPAASGIQVELPTAVGRTGRIYVIKNSSAYTIAIMPAGSETIDGASPKNLTLQYESITVQSTGTNWIIISKV